MLVSPFGNLYQGVVERLTAQVPAIRYIDQDLGQLENYDVRPPVSWPCCLLDIDEFDFTEMENTQNQMGVGLVICRIGLVKYTESNNLVPENIRENALQYFEIEQMVYTALHGWSPDGFTRLLRRKAKTEKRDDDIRVRIVPFAISFKDASAAPQRTSVHRPPVILD